MSECHDITLREAEGPNPNPPTLIKQLRDIIRRVFPRTVEDLSRSGTGWIVGKGHQEIAKAEEIKASAMEKLGRLEVERERLIKERQEMTLKAEAEQTKNEFAHREKMFQLETERFEAVMKALQDCKEKGLQLSAKTTTTLEQVALDLATPDQQGSPADAFEGSSGTP